MTRIAPLEPPFPPAIQARLDAVMQGAPPIILFTALARNARVFERFMAGGLLDKGTLTLREREIVIDRTTARCGSEYEWGLHVALFAAVAGLTADEIAATVTGAPVFSARETLLIRLVDALHDHAQVGDDLWSALGKEFSDEQLLESIALTGFYHTVSFLTNALKLPLEPNAARFPA